MSRTHLIIADEIVNRHNINEHCAGIIIDLFSLSAAFFVIGVLILAAKVICYYFASRWLEEKRGYQKVG